MMGFPFQLRLSGIKAAQANSLIGEAVNLASMGSVIYAIFLDENMPWWGEGASERVHACKTEATSLAEAVAKAKAAPFQKRRRIGCLHVG